ncbi:MAG: SPOR domain-containing protein [Fimbriimonadaceae bacterium]|nr:SPOR domain-containing protein [Fimbriimonadaceae bacterium]
MKRAILLKYWPAALFAISNVAAITLVLRANRSYEEPALPPAASGPAIASFEPLDAVRASSGSGDYNALLLDWGGEFDVDKTSQRSGGLGLFKGVGTKLSALRFQAASQARLEGRTGREADLLRRPLRLNFYDTDGGFLGQRRYLPPVGYTLPPLPAAGAVPFDFGGGQASVARAGLDALDVQIDPSLFRDPQAMTEFVTNLTQAMVAAGVNPRVRIGAPASVAGGLPAPSGPTLVAMPSTLPPARTVGSRVVRIPVSVPLPRPPADIVSGPAAPVYGDLPPGVPEPVELPKPPVTPDPEPTFRSTPGLGPTTPLPEKSPPPAASRATPPVTAPARPAEPPRAAPVVVLGGSDEDSRAKPSGPAAAPKPEPRVSIRIQLARMADEAAARAAAERLSGAGLGGTVTRDSSSGTTYWQVHTKTFRTRSEAAKALAQVRALGYEAWQS